MAPHHIFPFLVIIFPFLLPVLVDCLSSSRVQTTPKPEAGSPSTVILKTPYLADSDLRFLDQDPTSLGPVALLHLVKTKDLSIWLKAQGPDALYYRQGPILYLRRLRHRRQAASPSGGAGSPSSASRIVTPVLPITGEKKFNETDCMPWEEVAVLLRDGMHPNHKRTYIEPRTCNMVEGLECLPFEERGATVHRCKCQLIYGEKAVYSNYTDATGRIKRSCFIPAGLGWPSECFAKNWNNFGYPLPFGDPQGTNAEPAIQVDAYNQATGDQLVIEYIFWNSIQPKCVPFSECRERGTYQGQRCQCLKGHLLEKPVGKCSGAWGLEPGKAGVAGGVICGLIWIMGRSGQ